VSGLLECGMWHLVFDDLLVKKLTLSSHSVTKYTMLEVIAVGEGGEMDKVDISLLEGYGEGCSRDGTKVTEISEHIFLTVYIAVLFFSTILLCISLYMFRLHRQYSTLAALVTGLAQTICIILWFV
jgi:hypothetical protein